MPKSEIWTYMEVERDRLTKNSRKWLGFSEFDCPVATIARMHNNQHLKQWYENLLFPMIERYLPEELNTQPKRKNHPTIVR